MTSRAALRIGVIGVGGMGGGHCKALQTVPGARLTAVADIRPERAREVAALYGVPHGFESHRALIRARVCDLVMVSTPHPEHAKPVADCLNAGLHVFCEKPITERLSTARALVALARRRRRMLAVDFPLRLSPAYAAALDLIRGGHLGRPQRLLMVIPEYRSRGYFESGDWRATWIGEGGGVLLNQAPHLLDILTQAAGLPERLVALVARRRQPIEVEDTAAALLDYRSGATGYVYATTCEGGNGKQFEFVGERGRVVVQQGQLRRFAFDRPLAKALAAREAAAKIVETEVPVKLPAQPSCAAVWDHVIRHLRDGIPLRLDGVSGLDSLALSCAMVLSSERRQWVRLPVSARAYDAFLAARRCGARRATRRAVCR